MRLEGTDIYMIRGDTEDITVSCKNALGEKVPLVEGDKIYFTVKKLPGVTEKIFQKVITDFDDGNAYVFILHEDTSGVPVGAYYYDIQLNTATGKVKTIVPPSRFTLEEEVTYE